jgi:SPP1 family predicted phage head-tail adaptor
MAAPFMLDTKVTIERKTADQDPDYGTPIEAWTPVASRIWANVQDVLPSRAERTTNGLQVASQQARLRIRKQHQVTPDMRVILHGRDDKVMQIIAGPALLDDRMHQEFMIEATGV